MTRWLSAVAVILVGMVLTSVAEARWYDPSIGRFISADPVPNENGLKGYVFANNSPVHFVDPAGLNAVSGSFGGTIDPSCTTAAKSPSTWAYYPTGKYAGYSRVKDLLDWVCANVACVDWQKLKSKCGLSSGELGSVKRGAEKFCKSGTVKCVDKCSGDKGGYSSSLYDGWTIYLCPLWDETTAGHEIAHECGIERPSFTNNHPKSECIGGFFGQGWNPMDGQGM